MKRWDDSWFLIPILRSSNTWEWKLTISCLSVEFLKPPLNLFYSLYFYLFNSKLVETDQLLQNFFLNLSHVRFLTTLNGCRFEMFSSAEHLVHFSFHVSLLSLLITKTGAVHSLAVNKIPVKSNDPNKAFYLQTQSEHFSLSLPPPPAQILCGVIWQFCFVLHVITVMALI